jgi:hypothetical protein
MKKLILLSAITLSLISFSSCDKAEKLLFQPFESPLSVDVTIDPVTSTDVESSLGESTVNFNLDQEVKDATNGKLDGGVVGAMYIKEVAVSLLNPDDANNLSNFEYVTLSVKSGNATPAVFGPYALTAGSYDQASFIVANSPNIKQYFSGSNVQFELRGKAKNQTDVTLQSTISATIKFDK